MDLKKIGIGIGLVAGGILLLDFMGIIKLGIFQRGKPKEKTEEAKEHGEIPEEAVKPLREKYKDKFISIDLFSKDTVSPEDFRKRYNRLKNIQKEKKPKAKETPAYRPPDYSINTQLSNKRHKIHSILAKRKRARGG